MRYAEGALPDFPFGVGSEGAGVQGVLQAVAVGVTLAGGEGDGSVCPRGVRIAADGGAALVGAGAAARLALEQAADLARKRGGARVRAQVVLAGAEADRGGYQGATEVRDGAGGWLYLRVARVLKDGDGWVAQGRVHVEIGDVGTGRELGSGRKHDEAEGHRHAAHRGLAVEAHQGLDAAEDAVEVVGVLGDAQGQSVAVVVELVVGLCTWVAAAVEAPCVHKLVAGVGGGVHHVELDVEGGVAGAAEQAERGQGGELPHEGSYGHLVAGGDVPLGRREVDDVGEVDVPLREVEGGGDAGNRAGARVAVTIGARGLVVQTRIAEGIEGPCSDVIRAGRQQDGQRQDGKQEDGRTERRNGASCGGHTTPPPAARAGAAFVTPFARLVKLYVA